MLFFWVVVVPLFVLAAPAAAVWALGGSAPWIVFAAGVSLVFVGGWGVWMATVSPLQLQPVPAILFLAGLLLLVGDTGYAVATL